MIKASLMFFKKNIGFTLVELMVTVIILGILSTLAIPEYKKYTLRAHVAAAYVGLEFMTKRQIAFFYENREFHGINSTNPSIIVDPMFIQTGNPEWIGFYPIPPGSKTLFSYFGRAGKSDSTGTELGSTAINPSLYGSSTPDTHIRRQQTNPAGVLLCNNQTTAAGTFGVSTGPNVDWTILSAVGNLNTADYNLCTAIIRVLESSPSTNMVPTAKSAYVTYNMGE